MNSKELFTVYMFTNGRQEVQQYLLPGGICAKAPLPSTASHDAPGERVDKLLRGFIRSIHRPLQQLS